MGEMQLVKTAIREGVWRGELHGTSAPVNIEVSHLGQKLEGVTIDAIGEGVYALEVAIPVGLLSDGVQTFVITDADSDRHLGAFTLIIGQVADEELRAEIDLLRAELDMLKAAFRRHCLETT